MYCIIKCIVQGKQARVKNADLRHPTCAVVMWKHKSASPVLNVLKLQIDSAASGGYQGNFNTFCMFPMASAWGRTVHLSIILDNDQLEAHLLYFTICPLYSSKCFKHWMLIIRKLIALMQLLVSSLSVSDLPVHRLRESSLNLCTGRPLTESDDTRSCINTIQPPDDVYIMIKTCRGL